MMAITHNESACVYIPTRSHGVQLTWPDHSASTGYTFPPDSFCSLEKGLHLYVGIGGGPHTTSVIDTGSEGILFARRYLGKDYVETHLPFFMEYTSSKNTYKGTWVMALVSFSSSRDPTSPGTTVATTARMMLRAVDECNGETDCKKINTAMIGVGFDRDTSPGQQDSGGNPIPPNINPFLQLEDMAAGILRAGFILAWSTRSIVLGLPSFDDLTFTRITLQPQPSGPWTAPTVTVALPDAHILLQDVSLLMDCGIGESFIQAPADVQAPVVDGHSAVMASQHVHVSLSGLAQPLYSFIVGDAGSGAPTQVLWGHNLHDGMPFINTGRHALSQFDYLFDGDKGALGFRFR